MKTKFILTGIFSLTLVFGFMLTGCGEIEKMFEKDYDITVIQSSNGSVTANPKKAKEGAIITLTVAPATNYQLKADSLKINGSTEGITAGTDGTHYTFTMPAMAVTVTAEFELKTLTVEYDITVIQSSNGAVTASLTKAASGTTVTLTAAPNNGYALKPDSLKINGSTTGITTVTEGSSYTFAMPATDVTVTAEFEQAAYAVTIGALTGGTITANPTSAVSGTTITLTVTPSSDYVFRTGSLKVNGTTSGITTVNNTTYTFAMPSSNVTITAEFGRLYSVTIGTLTNGTITANPTTAAFNNTVTLTVTPGSGYALKPDSLKVNNSTANIETVTAGTTYTFAMPSSNVTVTAEFAEIITLTPVASIEITTGDITLPAGDSKQLTWLVLPTNASNKGLTWSSSNTAVAEVSSNGFVTAKTAGTATITAAAQDGSGITETCAVTVTAAATSGSINGTITITNGVSNETVSFTNTGAVSLPANGSATLTISGVYQSYRWFIDGLEVPDEADKSLVLSGEDYSVGSHRVLVIVYKNSAPYSQEIAFTVN